MDGERIAKLYAELGYPGAAKFQSALRKEGINVSLGNLKDLVKTLGSRQATAQVRRPRNGQARRRQVGG